MTAALPYDCSRGLVRRDRAAADVPLLVRTLGVAYLTLHLAVTGGVLVRSHARKPATYPHARTTLLHVAYALVVGAAAAAASHTNRRTTGGI